MSWTFEAYFKELIIQAQRDVGLSNFDIEVEMEQNFIKKEFMKENTIYVTIKYLTSEISFGVVTQPLQIMVLSEQNSLEASKIIFNHLAIQNNFKVLKYVDDKHNNNIIKQQYASPVVLGNFNEAAYGYRSVMYLSASLYIMENVADVENFTIGISSNVVRVISGTAETTELNNYFSGVSMSEESPLYLFYISDFTRKILQTQTTAFLGTFYGKNSEDEEEHGLFVVDGVKCAAIGSDDFGHTIKLYDMNEEVIKTINPSDYSELTIQVLPSSYSRTFEDDNFSIIFPNIIKNIVIFEKFTETIEPLTFTLGYSMTPNTQPIPPERIATSVKNISTLSSGFAIPSLSKYKVLELISNIMDGKITGNIDFIFNFVLNGTSFSDLAMKLISVQFLTAPNDAPSWQLGFIK